MPSSLCSIFLICSCSFCLKSCWFDQSQGFAHGMPGDTAFGRLAGHESRRKADCFVQRISPSNYLPSTTWNQELLEVLLDINSHQHTRRSSTKELKNIVLEPAHKSFLIAFPRSSLQHEWQTKLSHSPRVWALEILIPLLWRSKHHLLFQTDLSSWKKLSVIKGRGVIWVESRSLGALSGAMRQSGGSWQELLCRVLSWEQSKEGIRCSASSSQNRCFSQRRQSSPAVSAEIGPEWTARARISLCVKVVSLLIWVEDFGAHFSCLWIWHP